MSVFEWRQASWPTISSILLSAETYNLSFYISPPAFYIILGSSKKKKKKKKALGDVKKEDGFRANMALTS